MQVVTIYQGEDVCQQCLGWKRVDDGEQQSWRYWEELPTQSQVAVKMGLVKPIVCPRCNGSGREPMSDTRKDFYNELVANLQSSSLADILAGYASIAAWAVDFVRALGERPIWAKVLFRIIVGPFAYREFIGLMDELERTGFSPYFSYELEEQDCHSDPVPRKWWLERKPMPKNRGEL